MRVFRLDLISLNDQEQASFDKTLAALVACEALEELVLRVTNTGLTQGVLQAMADDLQVLPRLARLVLKQPVQKFQDEEESLRFAQRIARLTEVDLEYDDLVQSVDCSRVFLMKASRTSQDTSD